MPLRALRDRRHKPDVAGGRHKRVGVLRKHGTEQEAQPTRMELDMNVQERSAIRELSAHEVDEIAGGGLAQDATDVVTAVGMAGAGVYALAVMAMRDPWG
jgi:hypothetical protein